MKSSQQKTDAGSRNIAQGPQAVYTLADLRDWEKITAGLSPKLRLAVLGDPVAHSASPPMQNAALKECGLSARYTRLHIRAEELPEALSLLAPAGFLGVNLTIPHKTVSLVALDSLDPHAVLLGAVNTVRVEPGGSLRGFNTDGPGFAQAVAADLQMDLRGTRVLVLGAGGGAGRALATQCALAGCASLALANRTPEKAWQLADALRDQTDVVAVSWEDQALQKAAAKVDLVVNTSSLGLGPEDLSPLPSRFIPAHACVFDTVYRRGGIQTPLLAAAQEAGARHVGGLSLLLHQGALAFERWFDRPAPLEAMRKALVNA